MGGGGGGAEAIDNSFLSFLFLVAHDRKIKQIVTTFRASSASEENFEEVC